MLFSLKRCFFFQFIILLVAIGSYFTSNTRVHFFRPGQETGIWIWKLELECTSEEEKHIHGSEDVPGKITHFLSFMSLFLPLE